MNRYLIIFIILLTSLFTAFGDSHLKIASQNKVFNFQSFLIGFVVYCTTAFIWTNIYKYIKFSQVGPIYAVSVVLIFTVIGVFYFKESITIIEIVGIVMAIGSIILLARFN